MFRFNRALAAFAVVLIWAAQSVLAAHHPGDAAIRSVQFADEREGWACGDDGVIWHSIDGGQNWEQQASGVNASLRAIQFLTPYTGWAVGRVELPGGASRGVVLGTTDGGLKWSPIATQALPGLNCVKFFNQRNGIAAGDGSDLYATGLFTTVDGGQTWKPVAGKRCPTWLAADFSDSDNGALGGSWSQLATLRDGLFGAADVDPLGGRGIRCLKLDGPFAVAVGQGGMILTSSKSSGLKWGFAVPNLPKEVQAACDFSSVAIHEKHLWVVGRPGTFVLHSPDRGQTWEVQKTGQSLPLHTISFLNENLGWACGEMGTILSTRDGGKNWKVVRQEAQRAAALFVHASSMSIPFETIALLGEEDGYHTVSLRLTCAAAPSAPARLPEDDRPLTQRIEATGSHPTLGVDPLKLGAAMRSVGGTAGESLWQFPLPHHQDGCSVTQLLANWDRLHGERSSIEIVRQLVLAIRIWRPEVIVTDADKKALTPAETLLIGALKEAFKLAADPQAFPEQLKTLKLTVWSPKKLYCTLEKVDPAGVKIPLLEVQTRLADCPRDYANPADLIVGKSGPPVNERGYQLIATRLRDAAGDMHLMEGIDLAYGGQARRDLPPVDAESIKDRARIDKAVRRRRTFETLASGNAIELGKPEQVLAQIMPAIKEMPADFGARAVYAIASQYANSGQWVFARETYLILVEQYPNHPLAAEAFRWLVRYQSSSEARRRQELGHFAIYTETRVSEANPGTQTGIVKGGTEIVQASHKTYLRDHDDTRLWFKEGLLLEPRMQKLAAVSAQDPAMQLCFHSARRQLGEGADAKKWFSRYLSETAVPLGGQTVVRGADAWRDCAMAELWLINRNVGVSPAKPLAYCPRVNSKPVLDGKLNDDCWIGVKPLVATTTAGDLDTAVKKDEAGKFENEYTTTVKMTHDSENLYIAIHCTHPAGGRAAPVEKRGRDMDLRAFDRVSILLDLDRDYQTYYQLQIDQRGCLAEDCWGDDKWNPQWFVAVESNETSWTAEAAIPLQELTSAAPTPGTTWAANVTRIVPGRGVQAWSTPADAKPRPEGMGLLQFVQGVKRD